MIQENMALYLQQLYKFKETGKFSQFVKTPRQKKKKKGSTRMVLVLPRPFFKLLIYAYTCFIH